MHEDIEKVMLAAQSRVTYSDIEGMTLDEAKRYAATAPKRHVEQTQDDIDEFLNQIEEFDVPDGMKESIERHREHIED